MVVIIAGIMNCEANRRGIYLSQAVKFSDMLKHLRAAVSGPQREVKYECRRCGCMVDTNRQRCPECHSTEIASYHL